MICEKCNKKEASVHFTEVKNKKKVETHLCSKCAENYQEYITSPNLAYSVNDLLGGLLQMVAARTKAEENKLKCPKCGMDYYEFQTKGRLGCSNDYKAFRKKLKSLFQRIHGATKHVGKMPQGIRQSQKLKSLRKQLQQAVKEERYEDAAVIRDEIKVLEEVKDGTR